MTKQIYFGLFDTGEENPLISNFDLTTQEVIEIRELEIICAAYTVEYYSGDAFVLYRKDGKLYEVNDTHCSCNGLRNWCPEETTKEALLKRSSDYGVWRDYGNELREIINNLEDSNNE